MANEAFRGGRFGDNYWLEKMAGYLNTLSTTGTSPVGATHLATGQITASGTAATLVVARPTRTSVLFRNLDTSLSVYIGPLTVTAGNGMLLKAGESVSFESTGLIQVIAPSGSPVVAYADEYN